MLSSIIDALENLVTQNKAQKKTDSLQIETLIKSRLARILQILNQPRSLCVGFEADDDNSQNSSKQFLQMQKNHLIDLQEKIERYCNTLPVFGFNSVRYGMNLIKNFLLPILRNERDTEPIVIKKVNQFDSFKFGNAQLLDILHILGYAVNLYSILKAYKTSETKRFNSYEWFNYPDILNNEELPPCKAFDNKIRNFNPLENKYLDYEKLICSGVTAESGLFKGRLSEKAPNGAENYCYLP